MDEDAWHMTWWQWALVTALCCVALAAVMGCGTAPSGEAKSGGNIQAGAGAVVEAPSRAESAPVATQGGPSIAPVIEGSTAPVSVPVSAPQYGLDPERAVAERLRTKLWAGALGAAGVSLTGLIIAGVGWAIKSPRVQILGAAVFVGGLVGGLATWLLA